MPHTHGLLGEGSFGRVWKHVEPTTGECFAVKELKDINYLNRELKIVREISILSALRGHPNIVSLLNIGLKNNVLYLLFEFFPIHLGLANNDMLTKQHILSILYQILCGVDYIHSAGITHRDLKPSNILINEYCRIKICDFGSARAISDMINLATSESDVPQHPSLQGQLSDEVTTRWYRSPETLLLHEKNGQPPSDIWSVGCILAELVIRRAIFPGSDEEDTLSMIFDLIGTPEVSEQSWIQNHCHQQRFDNQLAKPRQPQDLSSRLRIILRCKNVSEEAIGEIINNHEDLFDLFKQIFEFNPDKRPTAEEALRYRSIPPLSEQQLTHEYNLADDAQTFQRKFSMDDIPKEDRVIFRNYLNAEFDHSKSPSTYFDLFSAASNRYKLPISEHSFFKLKKEAIPTASTPAEERPAETKPSTARNGHG